MRSHYQFIGILVATILIALAGCTVRGSGTADPLPYAGTTAPVPTAPSTETESAEPVDIAPPEIDLSEISRTAYLGTMSSEYPQFSESELMDFADLACDALEVTDPLGAVDEIEYMRSGLNRMVASAAVGSVIGSGYC